MPSGKCDPVKFGGSRSAAISVSAGTVGSARSAFIGMRGYSASAEALYPHFGITAEKVAEAARALL
jgi:transketolase